MNQTTQKSTIVEFTTDYDVFKKHDSNRPVDEWAVQRLMASIQKCNRLSSKPICVDHNFNVIDGQHRLEACKRIGIPVPYVIEDFSSEDMLEMNANQKSWLIADYLNYFSSEKGNPNRQQEYSKLKEFIKREKLTVSIAVQILNGDRSSDFFRKFRDGLYQFPTDEEYQEAMEKKDKIKETIDYIKRKTSGSKGYLDKVTFYSAMVDFFNIKSFEYNVFRTKLEYKLDLLRPCTRQCDYVRIFKDVYNWKNQSPIKDIEY